MTNQINKTDTMRILLSSEEKDVVLAAMNGKGYKDYVHVGERIPSEITPNVYYWVYFEKRLTEKVGFLTDLFASGVRCGMNLANQYK